MPEVQESQQVRTFYTDMAVLSDRSGVFQTKVYARQANSGQEGREVVLADWRRGEETPSINVVNVRGWTNPDDSRAVDEDARTVGQALLEAKKAFPVISNDVITASAKEALDEHAPLTKPGLSFQDNFRTQLKYRLTGDKSRKSVFGTRMWRERNGDMLFKQSSQPNTREAIKDIQQKLAPGSSSATRGL